MRVRLGVAFTALLLSLLAGCSGQGSRTPISLPQGPHTVGAFALGDVALVDDGTVGVSEPSLTVDPAGNYWVSGPTGFVTPAIQHNPQPYTHDTSMFKSSDGGKTWKNMQDVPGYGRDACPGGGDSDVAASPDGAIYLVDLYLGNVPIDVSKDGGTTWTFNCYTSIVPYVDRQWVAATNQHVWVAVNLEAGNTPAGQVGPRAEVYRSDKVGLPSDGLVFGPPVTADGNGPLVVDQTDGTLYMAGSGETVLVSTDAGRTFTPHDTGLKGHDLGKSFISIALDAKGHVFVAGSGKDGLVVSGSADKGKTWTPGVRFQPYGGPGAEYAFAWVAAGGDGTVDIAWYGQPPHADGTAYYVYALQKSGFLADPSNATYAWTQVTSAPIATKPLCQGINLVGLTPCDADGKHTRALGDFFESAVDNDGRFLIAFNDANGHEPPQLKVAKQTLGVLAPAGPANTGKAS